MNSLPEKLAATQGWWKGDPMSPDGVKFKTEFHGIPIHVDRPKGFVMKGTDDKGVEWERKYKYDYGFIPKTDGGDGDGLDVFIGPNKDAEEAYWAIQNKPDGSFDEYKVFLGFNNRDEATVAYRDHIPKKFLGGMVALKVDMMKVMLGMTAKGYGTSMTKAARVLGFLDELKKIEEKIPDEEKVKQFASKYINVRDRLREQVVDAAMDLKSDLKEATQ